MWILVVIYLEYGAAMMSMHEFNSKEACEQAKVEIQKLQKSHRSSLVACMEK